MKSVDCLVGSEGKELAFNALTDGEVLATLHVDNKYVMFLEITNFSGLRVAIEVLLT